MKTMRLKLRAPLSVITMITKVMKGLCNILGEQKNAEHVELNTVR